MTIDYHIIIGRKITAGEEKKIQLIIEDVFQKINKVYNKWNSKSEISKLNDLKAGEIAQLSAELDHFLHLTNQMVSLSDGKFDPSIESLQQLWKSHLEKNLIPGESDIHRLLPTIGWKNIHFDNGIFYKDHDETRIDLGGIAKGYCVDLLVEEIVKAGFHDVFVEWGGEVRANGMHPDNRPWNVISSFLEEADPEHVLVHVNLYDQAVATSGDYIQNWTIKTEVEETTLFHILDPKTGKPLIVKPNAVSSATVTAPTCVMADGLATVAMMFPSLVEANEWARKIEKNYPEVKFYLFSSEGGGDKLSHPLRVCISPHTYFSNNADKDQQKNLYLRPP